MSKHRGGSKRWIQGAVKKPGALHRQLGIPVDAKIPLEVLRWAVKQPGKLGQRARFALNMRGIKRKKKHRG